jgi:hypothetical protein
MISRKNGVRVVRHRPGSPAETRDSTRYSSAHWLTSRSGSGSSALWNGVSTAEEMDSGTSRGIEVAIWSSIYSD